MQPVHGKGVRVVYQEPERTTFTVGGIESFHEVEERIHLGSQTEVVRLEQVVASAELSFRTGFEEGCELTFVERVRRIDGEALILDLNLFRTASVPGITEEVARTSIYDYAERELGVTVCPVDAESGFDLVDAMLGLPVATQQQVPPGSYGEYYRYNPS